MDRNHIRGEFIAKRAGARLMAIVAEGDRERVYLSPMTEMQALAESAQPTWWPDQEMEQRSSNLLSGRGYGFTHWHELFTPRQLLALTTFSDFVSEARDRIRADAMEAGLPDDARGLAAGGTGASAYAEAVATYLAFAINRSADRGSSICSWDSSPKMEALRNTFGRQAIPMTWDFAEGNVFSTSSGNWLNNVDWVIKAIQRFPASGFGNSTQLDAQTQDVSQDKIISTDPPYYDNIGYADLSDFFYVWLRRSLRSIYPRLFATVAVPKAEELVATPYRHGGKQEAEDFFLGGMTAAMHNLAQRAHGAFPVTIYYAFKQSETKEGGTTSTGWVTFLEAVLRAGFAITGTWPMRTELSNRMIGSGTNALASSIILVCRSREREAPTASRRDFLRELKAELTEALEAMLGGEGGASPIAPVDLAQAAIGPGMAVFSSYAAVLEADGTPMSVHTALTLINKQVDEVLGGESFDAATNFCLGWFREVGWAAEGFGQADVLARAKGTSVQGVQQAGVLQAQGGKVKLLRPADYPAGWDPQTDNHTPAWEALHHLVHALDTGGESAAGALLARMPERSSDIRRLAFWLYTLCERKGWAEDARAYNTLVTAWPAIELASQAMGPVRTQASLDL